MSDGKFLENNLVIARLDKVSRNEEVREKLKAPSGPPGRGAQTRAEQGGCLIDGNVSLCPCRIL
ncbi:MAG: hypothetical protein ACE5JX_19755 [Acidobacteriota bacterium]